LKELVSLSLMRHRMCLYIKSVSRGEDSEIVGDSYS